MADRPTDRPPRTRLDMYWEATRLRLLLYCQNGRRDRHTRYITNATPDQRPATATEPSHTMSNADRPQPPKPAILDTTVQEGHHTLSYKHSKYIRIHATKGAMSVPNVHETCGTMSLDKIVYISIFTVQTRPGVRRDVPDVTAPSPPARPGPSLPCSPAGGRCARPAAAAAGRAAVERHVVMSEG